MVPGRFPAQVDIIHGFTLNPVICYHKDMAKKNDGLTRRDLDEALKPIALQFENMVTKRQFEETLKPIAHQLDNMVTKPEFDEALKPITFRLDNMALKLVKHDEEFREIKKNMMTKQDRQELVNRFDAFAQRSEDHSNKVIFHGKRLEILEEKSAEHETRITRLESPRP